MKEKIRLKKIAKMTVTDHNFFLLKMTVTYINFRGFGKFVYFMFAPKIKFVDFIFSI